MNSGPLDVRRESGALIGQTPRLPQATGGLVEDSEDWGSLRSPLHDLGRGLACVGTGTRKAELGGMTHPSPRFLPTSGAVTQEQGA